MGRRTVLEGFEQKSEPGLGLVGADADQLEDPLLDVDRVVADRAAADLGAVQHQVVGAGQQCGWIIEIAGGGGEGVVLGFPAALLVVPQEHRKLDHPADVVRSLRDQVKPARELEP